MTPSHPERSKKTRKDKRLESWSEPEFENRINVVVAYFIMKLWARCLRKELVDFCRACWYGKKYTAPKFFIPCSVHPADNKAPVFIEGTLVPSFLYKIQ
jgi:hypothetical protein